MDLLVGAEVHEMDCKRENEQRDCEYMTNEEYREELKKIFDDIDDNYILRWFYRFIMAKLEGSK